MRVLVAALLTTALVLFVAGGQAQPRGTIRLTASIADVRAEYGSESYQGAHTSTFLRLWNRAISGVPIGHAFISCVLMGRGGVFGGGVSSCDATYRLPRGFLTASGVQHSTRRYTLSVTGGTGIYAGAGGVVVATAIAPGVLRVQFKL